jgi:hypothetical protein
MKRHDDMPDEKVEELRKRVAHKVSTGTTGHSSSPEASSSPLVPPSHHYGSPGSEVGSASGPSGYTVTYLSASSSEHPTFPVRTVPSIQPAEVTKADSPDVEGPPDALEVGITYNSKQEIYSFTYNSIYYKKGSNDLRLGIAMKGSRSHVCCIYQGKSTGINFWFTSLVESHRVSPAVDIIFEDHRDGTETIYYFRHSDRQYMASEEE